MPSALFFSRDPGYNKTMNLFSQVASGVEVAMEVAMSNDKSHGLCIQFSHQSASRSWPHTRSTS